MKDAGLTRWCHQHSPCSADGLRSQGFQLLLPPGIPCAKVVGATSRNGSSSYLRSSLLRHRRQRATVMKYRQESYTAVAERPCCACRVYFVSFENSVKLFLCYMTPDNDILTTCIIVLVSFGCCNSWCYDPYVISYSSRSALFALFFSKY